MLSWWIVLLLMQSNDFRHFVCKPAFGAGFLFAEACMTVFLKPHTVLRRLAVDAYGDC